MLSITAQAASAVDFDTQNTGLYFDRYFYFEKNKAVAFSNSDLSSELSSAQATDLKVKFKDNKSWFFLGFNDGEIKSFFENQKKYSKHQLLLQALIPHAVALNCSANKTSTEFLNDIANRCDESQAIHSLKSCAKDAFVAAGKKLSDDFKSIKNAVQNPGKFLSDVKKQMLGLGEFITQIPEHLAQLRKTIPGLSSQVLSLLGCEALGELALPVLKMLLGGAGAASLALTVKAWVEKLGSLKHVLTGLSKASHLNRVDGKLLNELVTGAVRCEMAH